MRTKLTQQEITAGLASLPGWSVKNGKLHRKLEFENFILAFGFMAASAIAIEKRITTPSGRTSTTVSPSTW